MIPSVFDARVRTFFDDFVEAFRSFDGATIAERYLTPYLAFHSPGAVQVFMSRAEVASYFQQIVDGYRAAGCRSCRYTDLIVVALGSESAVGTVTWELMGAESVVIGTWRESYNLCISGGRLLAFTSTDHPATDLGPSSPG